MAEYNSIAYECSRDAASVVLDEAGTEWINEFQAGIELEAGDQVRVLGSFVNESETGDSIEIDDSNNKTNISFSPYIKGTTFSTSDNSDDLMKLGDFADIAFSTDAFGIEPPAWCDPLVDVTNGFRDAGDTTIITPADNAAGNYTASYFSRNDDNVWQGTPTQTSTPPNYKVNREDCGGWETQGQKSRVWGLNIDTSQDEKSGAGYSAFTNYHISNDFYISTLCKKIILPYHKSIYIGNTDNATNLRNAVWESLIYNPPVRGQGCLSGVPKPGYMICTVDIGDSTGWFDENGTAYQEVRDTATGIIGTPQVLAPTPGACPTLGMVNLKSGPQSVIGKVLAVRPIIHNVVATATQHGLGGSDFFTIEAFEVYVYDFFNPGKYNKQIRHTGAVGKFIKVNERVAAVGSTPLPVNTTTLNLVKQVHGAGEFLDDYSYNPAFNHINGMSYKPKSGGEYQIIAPYNPNVAILSFVSGDGQPGCMQNRPTYWSYQNRDKRPVIGVQPAAGEVITPGLTSCGEAVYDKGADVAKPSDYDYGYGKHMGLSFLWAGSDCGLFRYCPPDRENGTCEFFFSLFGTMVEQPYLKQFRANFISEMGLNNAPGPVPIGSYQTIRVINNSWKNTEFTFNLNEGVGGLICCQEETMKDIINGYYATNDLPTTGTDLPRVWFPYTQQRGESGYSERHMKGNGIQTLSTDGLTVRRTTNALIQEQRYDINFQGTPCNWNWRSKFGSDAARYPPITTGKVDNFFTQAAARGTYSTDFMPRYYSTSDGLPVNQAGNDLGCGPYQWGGYNNCNNSIYFQSPDTGDVDLNLFGTNHMYTHSGILGIGNTAFDINAPFATVNSQVALGDSVFDELNARYPFARITNISDIGGGKTRISTGTFGNTRTYFDGMKIMISTHGNYSAAGVNGQAWSGDMLMLKEHCMQIGVNSGFYTPTLIGDKLNKQLHDDPKTYAIDRGTFSTTDNNYSSPTTVGIKEQNLASEPTIINTNTIQTTLPDISYGFIPVTQNNATRLNQTASTKEITNKIINIDSYNAELNSYVFYQWWDTPAEQITTNLKVYKVNTSNTSIGYQTVCGKHCKFYTVPYLPTVHLASGAASEMHLFRLKGGALRDGDFDEGATPPQWDNLKSRYMYWETLKNLSHTAVMQSPPTGFDAKWTDACASYWWRTRLVRNLFPHGGSCRIFSGANNATIQFSQQDNRMQIANLYTPFRPHNSENKSKTDFGVGDAVPSAVINSRKTGAITDSLCGIYINNLATDALNQDNWGTFPMDNVLFDTDPDLVVKAKGLAFMSKLGYSNTFINNNINDFTLITDPYVFINRNITSGQTIRNLALVDSSVNAVNPIRSNCLNIAPVSQFMVQVDSDTVDGDTNPQLGNYPYYLVGSDFPGSQFFGSYEGQHLPIIGICARNFSSFNFVFDLGGSSITYTVNENTTIKSIRTKLMTPTLGTPQNISTNSSVIYLVTKANYRNPMPQQQLIQSTQQLIAEAAVGMRGTYYNQPQDRYRTSLPAMPVKKDYYESSGSYYPSTTEVDTAEEDSEDE